jgi:hypothetical protein
MDQYPPTDPASSVPELGTHPKYPILIPYINDPVLVTGLYPAPTFHLADSIPNPGGQPPPSPPSLPPPPPSPPPTYPRSRAQIKANSSKKQVRRSKRTPHVDPATGRLRVNEVACEPCRRVRQRCDGKIPRCEGCRRRSVPCSYNEPANVPYLKKKLEKYQERLELYHTLFSFLRHRSDIEVLNVVGFMRAGNDIDPTHKYIQDLEFMRRLQEFPCYMGAKEPTATESPPDLEFLRRIQQYPDSLDNEEPTPTENSPDLSFSYS